MRAYTYTAMFTRIGLYRLKVSVKEQGDKSALFIGSSMAIQTAQHYYNSILRMSNLI